MNKLYLSLNDVDQRLVRLGYYALNKADYVDISTLNFSAKELQIYRKHGVAVMKREKLLRYAGFSAALMLIVIFIAYIFNTSNRARDLSKKTQEHYSNITPVDACEVVTNNLSLFKDDIGAIGIQPVDLMTEYSGTNASCNFYLKGESGEYYYKAFISVNVDMTAQKQVDNTKGQEVRLIGDTQYNVFGWKANKNYYSISVTSGISPEESNNDQEYNDTLLKLIVLIIGTGIADKLPENTNVTDL